MGADAKVRKVVKNDNTYKSRSELVVIRIPSSDEQTEA